MQRARTLSLATTFLGFAGLAAAQTTWYVDASVTGPGSGTQADPYASIQYCLDTVAADGDTILVLPGTYQAVDYGGVAVRIAATAGPRLTTIDASNSGSAVTVQSAEGPGTSLEGFRITGGTGVPALGEDRVGGGLYLSSATLAVRGCVFEANDAVIGAGLFALAGDLVVEDTTFVDNTSHEGQPSVVEDGDGGAMYLALQSDVAVRGCTFDSNTAGGAPLNSVGRGGAIFVGQSNLVVQDSLFTGNFASCNQNIGVARGGAIHANDGAFLSIAGSVFVQNTAFAQTAQGGAVYVDDAVAEIRSSLFDRNYAADIFEDVDGQGGALYATSVSTVFVRGTDFQQNEAPFGGGAVAGYGTYEDCLFFGNKGREGGAVHAGPLGGLAVRRSTFVRNQATCPSNCQKNGGAVWGPARVFDSTLKWNLAHGEGGAAWGAFLRQCVLEGNLSKPQGNASTLAGGGAFNCTLVNCVVSNNRVLGDVASGVTSYGGGAAASELHKCEVFGNSADFGGGAANCDLDRVTLSQNSASIDGAGYWTDESRTVTTSILWGDAGTEIVDDGGLLSVYYSNVAGGWPGVGNVDVDPLWVDPANQDFYLQAGSPCIDAGDPALFDSDGSVADMGGIEFDPFH